jgi:hypothetical protein
MARGRRKRNTEAEEAKSLMGAKIASTEKQEEKQELKKMELKPQKPIKPFEAKISFDKWWMMTMKKRNLSPSMKTAVKKHFESRGFFKNGDFEKGLEDFGLGKS